MNVSLTPYVRARIAQEQVGGVLASLRLGGACPADIAALAEALEEIELIAEYLETGH